MRFKDEAKQEAIINATVKLVNEIGFVYSSVAKIAKEANVSPATLYIYYKNKEDLLVSTYIEIKKSLAMALARKLNTSLPLRDIFEQMWIEGFNFVKENPDYFRYTEQFANSPYSDLVNNKELEAHFAPIHRLLAQGMEQKVIKNVHPDILTVFIFFPIMTLANPKLCKAIVLDEKTIKQAFSLAWDAIKY
ncbi:MAG: TetR/AcrR family transcriptional regulator [Ignavibacteria bacterium]|nr:TetR/AcrR family transcriptional regulator [Ignavibacteria bacterium]